MAEDSRTDLVDVLMTRHGPSHASELGVDVASNRPADLFRLLTAALLFSARISAGIAVRAARALADRGWTDAERMAASTWAERAKTLNEAGYARYDERTATMLGETAELVCDRYRGDLRNLREEAAHDPARERDLLKECKGIGDVGVDIFFREVQAAWEELYPFVDERALATARRLGLGEDPAGLAALVARQHLPALAAALVRVSQAGAEEAVRRAATGQPDDGGGHPDDGDERQALRRASKAQLYERARELDVPGRSRMTKDELVDALARTR